MLFVIIGMTSQAQEKQLLKLLVTTPLPGFSGDFDHFGLDLKGKRLFLTAEDHKTVEVFDLMDGNRLKSITGFASPHAILFLPETNNLIVTDGDDNSGMVALVSALTKATIPELSSPSVTIKLLVSGRKRIAWGLANPVMLLRRLPSIRSKTSTVL